MTFLDQARSTISRLARRAWGIFAYLFHHPLAIAATVFLVVAAVAFLVTGRTFQIGGLLQRLWGTKAPDLRAVPPAARTGADGKPVEPGQSDDKGFVQAPVSTQIVPPGIFSNPDTITVVHPDRGQVTIALPTGVKNTDVKDVTMISPTAIEIANRDSGVNTTDLTRLIATLSDGSRVQIR